MNNSPLTKEDIEFLGRNQKFLIELLTSVKETVEENNETTKRIENKVDQIDISVKKLQSSFLELKVAHDDIDRKLIQLSFELTKTENAINEEELESYTDLCRYMYSYWEEYEELTRKLLPVSELLFKKLQAFGRNVDYSPVCIEICRALEFEIRAKIFREYVASFVKLHSKDIDKFLAKDQIATYYNVFEHEEKPITSITGSFQKKLHKAIRYPQEDPFFTLGEMQYLLLNVNKKPIRDKSILLSDFFDFLNNKTNIDQIMNTEFHNSLEETINNFRNPAAHPNAISLEVAMDCRNKVPEQIDYFERCIK